MGALAPLAGAGYAAVLSAAFAAPPAATVAAEPSRVEAALAQIDPDQLAPRDALDALYRLKTLLKDSTS